MSTATLGEVADFINGFAFKPADWHGDGLPIIRIQNLTDASKPINRTTRAVPDKFRVRKGDLLVSWSATLGVFTWNRSDEALVNQHIFRVVPSSKVEQSFLRHMLRGALSSMQRHMHGATMQHVNRAEFLATEIPLPPLPEQRRIAAILDHADALRAKRRQVLASLDALGGATFIEIFGPPEEWPRKWPMGTIGELATSVAYGTSSKAGSTGAWPILRMGNVTDDGRLDLSDLKYIDLAPVDVEKYTVRPGDMLFNRTNSREKVGKAAVVRTERPLAVAGYLVRVRFDDAATAEFVSAYLTSGHGVAVRRTLAKAAVNQANINATQMRAISIANPPMSIRKKFADALSAIDVERSKVESAAARDDELFSSLQSRAFRGEL